MNCTQCNGSGRVNVLDTHHIMCGLCRGTGKQPVPPAIAEAYLRQAPLPKAHDPYEWTGWPLFEMYGLAGDGGPCSTRGKRNG